MICKPINVAIQQQIRNSAFKIPVSVLLFTLPEGHTLPQLTEPLGNNGGPFMETALTITFLSGAELL